MLAQAGHAGLARYYTVLSILMWVVGFLVFLPRTQNASVLPPVRLIGRVPLFIRYLLLVLTEVALFKLGSVNG